MSRNAWLALVAVAVAIGVTAWYVMTRDKEARTPTGGTRRFLETDADIGSPDAPIEMVEGAPTNPAVMDGIEAGGGLTLSAEVAVGGAAS